MKRLIAAAVLIFFVATANITSCAVTEHYYDEMLLRLSRCVEDFKNGDKKTAAVKAAALEDYWNGAEGYLIIFVNRGSIDEISMSTAKLHALADAEDDSLFLAEAGLLSMLISHMHDTEQVLVY